MLVAWASRVLLGWPCRVLYDYRVFTRLLLDEQLLVASLDSIHSHHRQAGLLCT